MKKKNVIRRKDEFTKIIKEKKYVLDATLTLYYSPRKEEESRVGISITNKLGNAVTRNRAKRQLRELVTQVFNWQEDFDAIIIVRENFKNHDFQENKKCLERCYKKVKIERKEQG